MAEEYLDVLTPDGQQMGTAKPRDEIHKDGSWHASVHIWVLDGDQVLLQKRSENKESFPGLYDLSAAGHVRAGETPKEAAVRETREEIGLSLTQEQLQFVAVQQIRYRHDEFVSNEFNSIYVVTAAKGSWDLRLQTEEVAGACWMKLSDLQADLEKNPSRYCIDPEEEELIFCLAETSNTYYNNSDKN